MLTRRELFHAGIAAGTLAALPPVLRAEPTASALVADQTLLQRIAAAPERRVFYIDVKNVEPHHARYVVAKMQAEIHSRRSGGVGHA